MNKPQTFTLWQWRDYKHSSFTIEVSHSSYIDSIEHNKVENIWHLYVYVYEKHPWFAHISDTNDNYPFFDVDRSIDIKKWHYDKSGKTICKVLGGDYNHLHDDRYRAADMNNCRPVFFDAERLWDMYMEAVESNK